MTWHFIAYSRLEVGMKGGLKGRLKGWTLRGGLRVDAFRRSEWCDIAFHGAYSRIEVGIDLFI